LAPQAVPADNPWRRGSSTLAGNFGLGSAVGVAGVTYSYMPVPLLETEVGFGAGLTGVQFSVMQKIVVGWGATRFIAGVGLAYSPGGGIDNKMTNHLWLNADLLGFEIRTSSHFVFFLAGGLTYAMERSIVLFNDGDVGNSGAGGMSIFPQFRIGLGRTF
jgi:hypothetical protein